MAMRVRDEWLSMGLGPAASLHDPDALIPEDAGSDTTPSWGYLWSTPHNLVDASAAWRLPVTKTVAVAQSDADGSTDGGAGGGGPGLAAPPAPGGEQPQFLGDAIGDNTSSTTTIAVGGTLSSQVDQNTDLDYIRVTLVAGQTYTLSLDGITLVDAYLDLKDAGGAQITFDDDNGPNRDSFLIYTPSVSSDYWLVAHSWNSSGSGTYTLAVNTIQTGNTSPTTPWDNASNLPYFSWDQAAIQITRDGDSWASSLNTPTVVTYAYRSSAPPTMPDDTGGFSRFNAAQITAAESTLAAWAAVANIQFVRVDDGDGFSNNATILLGNYSTGAAGAAAFAYTPQFTNASPINAEGDVWVNVSIGYNQTPVRGDYGYTVLLHEIGHALGLSHPGDYNAAPGVDITYQNDAEYYNDSRVFTVMSYFGSIASSTGDLLLFPSLPQPHDIAAIQRLYGSNLATRTGDTTYGYNSNTGVAEYSLTVANQASLFAIWDGGGNDTLDLSGYTTASTIDLRQEAYSSAGPGNNGVADFNISIARGVVIENAIGGSGADTIIGNSANNTLNGGAGADTMSGGAGDDTYVVDNAGDVVTESTLSGTDTIQASINWATLGANIENLTLTGSATTGGGNGDTNVITGNAGSNTLSGFGGNDTLNGLGGVDFLGGGGGDDVVNGGAGDDVINYFLGDGVDTLDGGADSDTLNITGDANLQALTVAFNGSILTSFNGGAIANVETVNGNFGGGGDTLTYVATAAVTANLATSSASGFAVVTGLANVTGGDGNDALTGDGAVNQLNGGAGNDTLNGAAGAARLICALEDDTF
jgi:serralysin